MALPRTADLLVTPFYAAETWQTVELETHPRVPNPGDRVDLDRSLDADALRQALVLRLLTPIGSLAALGHAAYGCRLHELIGEPWSATLGLRARSWVLQAVRQETRVAKVLALTVEGPSEGRPDRIAIGMTVLPTDSDDPLVLGIEVATS